MPKKLLWGIIAVLFITNIATLLFLNNNEEVLLDESDSESKISNRDAVATVGEQEVLYEEWMKALRKNYGQPQLKELVDQKIIQTLAEENNIEINEKVIEKELAYLTSMNGPLTEAEYMKVEENWRDDVLARFQLQFLLTKDYSIPEEQLETYYEQYQNQYDFSEALQLSHILVQNMEIAEKVYEELEAGASFDLLAKEYSLDEETRTGGGYLGFMTTSSQFLPSGYEEVALDRGEHVYSEPFITDNGVAIIYIHQVLPEIEFSYEEIKDYVEAELILHEEGIDMKPDLLWDEYNIDWIYEEGNKTR